MPASTSHNISMDACKTLFVTGMDPLATTPWCRSATARPWRRARARSSCPTYSPPAWASTTSPVDTDEAALDGSAPPLPPLPLPMGCLSPPAASRSSSNAPAGVFPRPPRRPPRWSAPLPATGGCCRPSGRRRRFPPLRRPQSPENHARVKKCCKKILTSHAHVSIDIRGPTLVTARRPVGIPVNSVVHSD